MIVLISFLIVVVSVVFMFNRLTRYRMFVREAWSGIDVQLKRRYTLIPNLVDVVKGYTRYEHDLFKEVTSIRTQLTDVFTAKEKAKQETNLSQVLKGIFALVENYPDLKANNSFLELQKSLSEIEDQIQMARRYYNGTVRNYNILVESFPSNLVAQSFSFKPMDFFEIEYATERKSPDIAF